MSEPLTTTQVRTAIEAAKAVYQSTGDSQQARDVAWGVAQQPKMVLRRAGMDDAQYLYDLRMDPVTRANSRQTGEIPWERHLEWLARTLADPRETLYVAMLYGVVPVGTGRLSRGDHDIEVSITIDPRARGQGYARLLIEVLEAEAAGIARLPLVAQILSTNLPSLVAFLRSGFELTEMVDDHNIVADWTATSPTRRWVWTRKS